MHRHPLPLACLPTDLSDETTMHRHPLPLACLPTDLSDETAAKLLELLYEIARTLENHYAVHINRYYHPGDDRQPDLWDGHDPPF